MENVVQSISKILCFLSSSRPPLLFSDVVDIATSQLHHHYMVDYERLGLTHRAFRLSNANSKYELSKSYPSVLVVPSSVADESFAKIGKGFKHGRFPVVTWKSEDDALLIRGAGLASQTVVARIKKQANLLGNAEAQASGFVGSRVSLNSRDFGAPNSVEMQERYMSTFVALSPHATSMDGRSLLSESMESLLSLNSMVTFDGISLGSATPDIYRKTQTSDFTRHATNFVRSSGGRTGMRPMNNGRTTVYGDYVTNQTRRANTILPSSQSSRPLLSLTRSSLYVFGDRNQAKMLKLDKGCEFIPVSYPSTHNVKIAFKKFLRAVCPSWTPSEEHSISFYKQLDDSSWLQMVSSLMNLSNAIVDLIDLQHSSVCVCIEDGWDATCQIIALSQLLLDPYYRTIDGFRVLIEKEWLAFGHRFSHRGNHSVLSQNSGIAPMFLMFLDAVHQVHEQNASAFEFNDFFLRFLAYHSSSACFRTFVLNSECERVTFDTLCVSVGDPRSASIWTYINEKRQRCPIFNNFCYAPDLHGVLRPQASIASLTLWPFFSEDHLAHGSPYDIEVAELEEQEREDEQFESLSEMRSTGALTRRVLDSNYRECHLLLLDGFSTNLDSYSRIRALIPGEDDKTNEPWTSIMAMVDVPSAPSVSFTLDEKESSSLNGWRHHVQRAVHKKETVKLLLRGMTHQSSNSRIRDSVASSNTGHHFMPQHVMTGDSCAVCHQNVPGVVVRIVHRCSTCGMICHEKCSPLVSSTCPNNIEEKRRSVTPKPEPLPAISKRPSADTTADSRTLTMSASRPHANATHCGFLMKKGATFKMWKPRWFVLDASRHQLRYYESETDVNCRGIIELADIKGVEVSCSHALRKPLIEIRTVRRVYSLLAETKNDADVWMEKILAALRD
ncbi:unnamed protein product [Toxocara canis]|uniref:Myotubularin phosphatase domain-containing protein n=1 Tax=Toxocara canis TaxID=6265 RepID=A0A183UGD7_TOXCA|nr:unnamed protein product [Toxocara canis]